MWCGLLPGADLRRGRQAKPAIPSHADLRFYQLQPPSGSAFPSSHVANVGTGVTATSSIFFTSNPSSFARRWNCFSIF